MWRPGNLEAVTVARASSPSNVWVFAEPFGQGARALHWNGTSWTRTSVARLLPAGKGTGAYNLAGVYAVSADNVYAIADSDPELGASSYILHWNGRVWSKVAYTGGDTEYPGAITGDGRGGIWLVAGFGEPATSSAVLHYSDGKLTTSIPVGSGNTFVAGLSQIAGTPDIFAATEAGSDSMTILEYTPLRHAVAAHASRAGQVRLQ
jgi:hypothetical protein